MSKTIRTTRLFVVAFALWLPFGSGRAQTSERPTLNVASLGGELDRVFKKAFEPFEAAHGVTIRWTPGVGAENLAKVAASKAKPEFDIAIVENLTQFIGSGQDLWAPIDPSIVTNYADLYPQARPPNNDSVGIGFFLGGFFYQSEEFAKRNWEPPKRWADLFRPEFCGRIGLLHPNVVYTVHTLIMLSGGDPKRIHEGISRLASLKDCIKVLEPSAPKLEEKIQLGEYLIGIHGNIRVVNLIRKGLPIKFTYPEEGTVVGVTMASPVKNAPNPKLAQEFLNWFIRADVQQQVMEGLFYGPTNRKVAVSDGLQAVGVPSPQLMSKMITVDDSLIVNERREWVRQTERAMQR